MPTVSIIVPCYNEEKTISQLLDAIKLQTFPLSELEVVIADGISSDRTRMVIQEYQARHPELTIRIIDNQKRVIPSGLNRAIEAASGNYIVRMDAHSKPCQDYIQRCIDDLEKGLGDNVGGVWVIQPGDNTWLAKAIAIATSHPLGAGDARYRIGGIAQQVDTVPFGAFKKELFQKVGMFDETLLTNEDYEFNTRIRQSGGKIWLDPAISSIYYARPNVRELARQYLRYGYWKVQMLRKYPKTLRWRQFLPPLFVLSILLLFILCFFWPPARWLLGVGLIVYTIVVFFFGILMGIKNKNLSTVLGFSIALATIHLSWGASFLWGILHKHTIKEPLT
jgi:succinoglycan biosynthesis protein ExoA